MALTISAAAAQAMGAALASEIGASAGRPGGPVSPGSFAGSIAPTEWSA